MLWFARFLAAGSTVTIAALLSRRLGPATGGMVLAFPFVIGTGLLFALVEGREQFRSTALGVLWGLLPLLCFSLVVLAVSRSHAGITALSWGAFAWVSVATAVYWLR